MGLQQRIERMAEIVGADQGEADKLLDELADQVIELQDKKAVQMAVLDWLSGAFNSQLAKMLKVQVGDANEMVRKWAKG